MTYYERNLPHWHPDGRAIFLTWRLHRSLPEQIVAETRAEKTKPGQKFARIEGFLDGLSFGPLWLKEPELAAVVESCILRGARELQQYRLLAYVVMPNHVHLLVEPRLPLARITKGIKGGSASEANRILKRRNLPFWQGESFDHWVRNASEGEKIVRYIENNPVKARLASRPEDWQSSSARQ